MSNTTTTIAAVATAKANNPSWRMAAVARIKGTPDYIVWGSLPTKPTRANNYCAATKLRKVFVSGSELGGAA